jgi:hypothetical protein
MLKIIAQVSALVRAVENKTLMTTWPFAVEMAVA